MNSTPIASGAVRRLDITSQTPLEVQPVVLEGHAVRLEPLTVRHADGLSAIADRDEIWQFMSTAPRKPEELQRWIDDALKDQAAGTALPFAIVDRNENRVVGSTRYLAIAARDRGLEIGWTWHSPSVWRTAINTECKLLLLRHAFETLGCLRVQFKTDARNERSRRAIERVGASFEGILRNHMIVRAGVVRDSAYYSVIDTEWPDVKAGLIARIR